MAGSSGVGVLHVVLSLAAGGTERLVIETVRRLRNTHRMAVCCLDAPGVWADELRQDGIEVTALGRRPGFHPSLGTKIARLAADRDLRVLHCHQYSPFVYGCVARLVKPGLRLIFTEHGRANDDPPSRKRRWANALLARIPQRVCAVSADLGRHLEAEGFAAGQLEVVTNGIDPGELPTEALRREARASLGLDNRAFVVGTAGRLNAVKDIPTLIDAFRQVAAVRPEAHLVVVGDGPERVALESAANAAAPGRVHFAGHRTDVRQQMAGFDVYVSSSVFEGVSLTILEAMAAGRPVVATGVGGTPEVVVHGATGLLVPPRDPSRLAQALQDVAADRERARAMGLAGRSRVCETFTFDRMVSRYAAAYAELGSA
jgi:glycosyltransferase involved in cell wall biosynthesis